MFIVAELSANHNGSLDRALKTIEAAKKAGADAVKFQTFQADQMVGNPDYVIETGPWAGKKLINLYRDAETPRSWHLVLFEHARELGLVPFSTPFSCDDVDFLERLNCPIYKIASFEIVDTDLIRYAASTGKPLIISTGMASEQEIDNALEAAMGVDITLLQCTSAYPASSSEANVRTMQYLRNEYQVDVGVSDHTLGSVIPIMATAMGAKVIEKHLTLCRADGGPDSGFSLEPYEFAEMVKNVREAEQAIGQVQFGVKRSEKSSYLLRRSLWWANNVQEGAVIEADDIISARPANGLPPYLKDRIVGQIANKDYRQGEPVG